jgi:hypothetical protein
MPVLHFTKTCGLIILLPVLALQACALAPFDDDGAARQGATLARVATPVQEPAGFVRESRPPQTTYLPVGVTPAPRPVPARTAIGAQMLEAELDMQRNAARAFATRPKPQDTYDGTIPPRVAPPPKELTPQ